MSFKDAHKGAGRNTYLDYDQKKSNKKPIKQVKTKRYNPDESEPLQNALQKIRDNLSKGKKRLVLSPRQYRVLTKYVYERDGWCVFCGRPDMLTPAHIIRRSQAGNDSPNNIVAACIDCHTAFDKYEIELPDSVAVMLENEPERL